MAEYKDPVQRLVSEYKDPADSAADSHIEREAQRKDSARRVLNETDKLWSLKGGRNNPTAKFNRPAPGTDDPNPLRKEMATYSAKFVERVTKGDRAGANAARVAFHAVKNAGVSVPKGVEVPCPTGDCKRTNEASSSCAKTGGCEFMAGTGGPKVGRPRG